MSVRPGGLLLVCVFCALVAVGCAGTTPSREAPEHESVPASVRDSAREAHAEPSPSSEDTIDALRAAYVEGEYETVVRRARRQLRDSLSSGDALRVRMLLGRAEQARGNHERAIEALRAARVTAVETGHPLVRLDRALGESYAARYRWSSAASAFRRVLEVRPDDRATRQALAEVYRRSRDWTDAKQQYERLVRRDSSKGQWWARLAKCEIQRGEIGAAIPHLARAHQLLPRSSDVALTLSRYYRATLRRTAARRVVDSTLTHRPGDPRLWRRRADLAFERDDFDRARWSYRRAIETGDSSATPYRRIGMIEVRKQRYERALSALHHSFRKDSTNARTTLYLGIAHLRLDRPQQASAYLQRTIAREARGPITRAFVQMGQLHDQRGDVPAAVRAYRTALRLRPERTDVYFHLAVVYDEYYREKATAARHYRRFLRISDSTDAQFRAYARDRLQALRSTLHMQNGPLPPGSPRK